MTTPAVNDTVETVAKTAPKKGRSGGVVVECPGIEAGSWSRWYRPEGGEPEILRGSEPYPAKSRRVVTIPTDSLFSWPLWISGEGDPGDLVRLELSGRHLLKKGMEESLNVLPIDLGEGRRLVLAVAAEEPFQEGTMPEGWFRAEGFEFQARLLGDGDHGDMILWKEHGILFAALYRNDKPVWFSPLTGGECGGVLRRTSLRLLSEGIIMRLPRSIKLDLSLGSEREDIARELSAVFPHGRIIPSGKEETAPRFHETASLQVPPAEARRERDRKTARERLLLASAGVGFLYLLLLIWGAGDLLLKKSALRGLKRELDAAAPIAEAARKASERWKTLRPAVDPSIFPLDLLSAVAAPTEGGKVRLTSFTVDHGKLQVSGEATDVSQAYAFIDQLKKNPMLHAYEWTAGQPQLAGKNSVKFDMEGTRPDEGK